MSRVIFWFTDSDNYVNVVAEEFHEDNGFLKAYNSHHELVAMFRVECVKGVYISEKTTGGDR